MIIEWTPEAIYDFDKSASYIAEKSSVETVKKWKNKIKKSLRVLETFPEAGRKVGKYRVWLVHKNYKVFYIISAKEMNVKIIHFRHAKRKPLRYK
jgi:plasmid stabilization system protein ParE